MLVDLTAVGEKLIGSQKPGLLPQVRKILHGKLDTVVDLSVRKWPDMGIRVLEKLPAVGGVSGLIHMGPGTSQDIFRRGNGAGGKIFGRGYGLGIRILRFLLPGEHLLPSCGLLLYFLRRAGILLFFCVFCAWNRFRIL